jgi:glycosyltransferase involved in cell wall biosynthesis
VSVIIPVYNRSGLLSRAVRSVLGQTLSDIEIIVVDDGSTDDIRAVLDGFKDERIRSVRHEGRRGAAAARNTGVRHARGSHLSFLDSDDEWFPSKLEEQLQYMNAHDGEVCCASYYLRRESEETVAFPSTIDPNSELLFGCSLGPGSTLMTTREAFSRVGPFLETLLRLEDWDWLLRCRLHYKILIMPSPLVRSHFSINPENAPRIIQAVDLIRSQQASYGISWQHPLAMIKFQSTIFMEKSAAAYWSGRLPAALYWGLLCFVAYPFRNRSFYKRRFANLRTIMRPRGS